LEFAKIEYQLKKIRSDQTTSDRCWRHRLIHRFYH